MSEAEGRAWAFNSSRDRIIAMIEECSRTWTPNGPSRATAERIIREIQAMSVPGPAAAAGDQQ
jgi:hypothetical protein